MTSGIVRKLYFIYWGSSESSEWKNARTDEIIYELLYNDAIRLPLRPDLQWVLANCNRHTESYRSNFSLVEQLRSKKIRYCPLIYVELWKEGIEKKKEEYWVIDSDYWMKSYLKRLVQYFNTPNN